MILRGVPPMLETKMREAAAYDLLPLCNPMVAPICYHISSHEESGSYSAVFEDLTNRMIPIESIRPCEGLCKRVLQSLAAVHGRFLQPDAERVAAPTSTTSRSSKKVWAGGADAEPMLTQREKLLRGSLLHQLVFFSMWQSFGLLPANHRGPEQSSGQLSAIDVLEDVFGVEADSDNPALSRFASTLHTSEHEQPVTLYDEAPVSKTFTSPIAVNSTSLTLIHGAVTLDHVAVMDDSRGVPSCYLLDWKHCGIGPLEVDIVHSLLTFLMPEERLNIDVLLRILSEYVECLGVFYGVRRDVLSLLGSVRDVGRVLMLSRTRAEGFGWGITVAKRDLEALMRVLDQCFSEEALEGLLRKVTTELRK
jgi:hypothetical protein